ncbi:hypothetical protein QFZ94_002093 [Paraburkholderia sp. JPY465]
MVLNRCSAGNPDTTYQTPFVEDRYAADRRQPRMVCQRGNGGLGHVHGRFQSAPDRPIIGILIVCDIYSAVEPSAG